MKKKTIRVRPTVGLSYKQYVIHNLLHFQEASSPVKLQLTLANITNIAA